MVVRGTIVDWPAHSLQLIRFASIVDNGVTYLVFMPNTPVKKERGSYFRQMISIDSALGNPLQK
jgi:hypothetical protein